MTNLIVLFFIILNTTFSNEATIVEQDYFGNKRLMLSETKKIYKFNNISVYIDNKELYFAKLVTINNLYTFLTDKAVFKSLLVLKDIDDFIVFKDTLFYLKDNKIYKYKTDNDIKYALHKDYEEEKPYFIEILENNKFRKINLAYHSTLIKELDINLVPEELDTRKKPYFIVKKNLDNNLNLYLDFNDSSLLID